MDIKDYAAPIIVALVAIMGLVMTQFGGPTGAASKGTQLDFPVPTYGGGMHPDFPEVSKWAYYQYGIRTANGQLGLDYAPLAAKWVNENVRNEHVDSCSIGCSQYCPETYLEIGYRLRPTECLGACESLCEDIIESEISYRQY